MDNIVYLGRRFKVGRDGVSTLPKEADFRRCSRRRLRAGGRVILVCRSRAQCDHWAAALPTEGMAERRGPQQRLRVTAAGRPAYASSRAADADPSGAALLEILTRTALFGRVLPLPLLLSEPAHGDYLALLLSRAQSCGLDEQPVFRWLAHQGACCGTMICAPSRPS